MVNSLINLLHFLPPNFLPNVHSSDFHPLVLSSYLRSRHHENCLRLTGPVTVILLPSTESRRLLSSLRRRCGRPKLGFGIETRDDQLLAPVYRSGEVRSQRRRHVTLITRVPSVINISRILSRTMYNCDVLVNQLIYLSYPILRVSLKQPRSFFPLVHDMFRTETREHSTTKETRKHTKGKGHKEGTKQLSGFGSITNCFFV